MLGLRIGHLKPVVELPFRVFAGCLLSMGPLPVRSVCVTKIAIALDWNKGPVGLFCFAAKSLTGSSYSFSVAFLV